MKPMIAVISCHKDERCIDAQRNTWATKDSPISTLFFVGRAKQEQPKRSDVVVLDCSDTYEHLPRKVQLAVYWARCHGFTVFFKLDDDAYMRPERLVFTGEYVGKMMPAKKGYSAGYAHGGAGYLLGERAMDVVISTPIPSTERSEDGFVANALANVGIVGRHDPRLIYTRRVQGDPFPETPTSTNQIITTAEFAPAEFSKVHRLWTGRGVEDQMSADEYKRLLIRSGQWRAS